MPKVIGTLFYSSKCKYCTKLIKVITDADLLAYINMSSVDNISTERLHQMNIRMVPHLVVSGTSYETVDAFKWISEIIKNRDRENEFDSTI